jgi:inosine-uridine nucleoside N-ribohydrolase
MKRKIILDTDPGVDDAMAIAYALCHPKIDLLALSTVFGNVDVDQATRNAQFVLDTFGATNVKVAKGLAVPSVQPARPAAESVHGGDGLGNCYPAKNQTVSLNKNAAHAGLLNESAPEFIVNQARAQPGEITVIAVGPLTNIAAALVLEPELPHLLQELIVMGGTVIEPGNVSPVAEANFLNDPHAADAVLAADWPITVVGLDVTHKILIGNSHLAQLRDSAGATGDLLWHATRFYVDFYASKRAAAHGEEPACAMHDAAAVAYMLMPDAFEVVRGAARVVDSGVAIGQLAMDRKGFDYLVPHWADRQANATACMQADVDRVRADFLETLITHHQR